MDPSLETFEAMIRPRPPTVEDQWAMTMGTGEAGVSTSSILVS